MGVRWFEKRLTTRVGNVEGSSFLNDPLLEGGPLRSRFSRLFNIYVDRKYFSIGNVEVRLGVEGYGWRRSRGGSL